MQAMRPPRTPEVDELALQQSIARRASAGRGPWLTLFPFFAGEDSTTAYQEQVDEDAEMPADSGDRGPKWEKLWSGQKVIRSISSSHVLADFGHHLRSKHGSAATYALSKPADDFDAFLSHSWRDSGLLKYLALSYHFNLRSALLATLAACVLLALGHATFGAPTPLALFPSLCAADVARGFERSKGTEFILVGHATFLIVLLFGHRMPRLVRPRKLFLDKMCIHQTDEVQKRRGILSLWEFLRKSKTMVVLYNDDCARLQLDSNSRPARRSAARQQRRRSAPNPNPSPNASQIWSGCGACTSWLPSRRTTSRPARPQRPTSSSCRCARCPRCCSCRQPLHGFTGHLSC